MTTTRHSRPAGSGSDHRDYRLLYVICLPLFLAAALAGRVLPARWRPWPRTDRSARSILAEARAAAGAYLPYAMMG